MIQCRIRSAVIAAVSAMLLLLAFPALAPADDAAVKGREMLGKWSDAVVSLKLVLRTRMSSEGKEVEQEEHASTAMATVIDPSGLLVTSLSTVDPSHMMEAMSEEEPGFKMETEIRDIKICLADGKEIPAKILLRDKDLDLAYLRPTDKLASPLTAVDLADSAKPGILDEILLLSRLGEVVNRAPTASLDRILAVVEKPRTLYVPGLMTMVAGVGCPVFTLDGKIVGLLVIRSMPGAAGSSDTGYGNAMPVIIPAADVIQGARQVPQ